jgi:hypothetical protein
MNQNTQNIKINENTLVEIDGISYSLKELQGFIETSKELSRKVNRQSKFIEALKLNNSKLTIERNRLCDKCIAQSKELKDIKQLTMFEFGNLYCSSESLEEAGHMLARELLGKPATTSDFAEEEFIANGENQYAKTYGDDY